MGKKIVLILATCCLSIGYQVTAWGLSIGKAEVKSSLNEPLDASIPFVVFREEELENLKIDIELFETSSVGQFVIQPQVIRDQEHAYIKLSSKEVVREPVISFILGLEWLAGQLKREYSLLINPPQP